MYLVTDVIPPPIHAYHICVYIGLKSVGNEAVKHASHCVSSTTRVPGFLVWRWPWLVVELDYSFSLWKWPNQKTNQFIRIDWSLKVYTQLAREGVVLTQDGDTELSLVLSSRRVTARGDSCKEAIGEITLPFLPLSVSLYVIHKSLIDTWNSLI